MRPSAIMDHYRWAITARVILAFFGGFWATSAVGALFALLLKRSDVMPLAQAVHIMTLAGFLLWCALAMWAFYAPRLSRVTTRMLGSAVLLTGAVFLLK